MEVGCSVANGPVARDFVKKQVSRHWVGATSLVIRNHPACLAALLGPER